MIRRVAALMPLLVGLAFIHCATAADWKEPADKVLSEEQVKSYLAATNDWMDDYAKIMQSMESATNQAERIAAVTDIDKRHQAALDRHHISAAEYDWVGQRVTEAWALATYIDEALSKSQEQLQSSIRETDKNIADARKRLADYQLAQKEGRRILSEEDRAAAVKSAKQDQQAAVEESKQHAEEGKTALDEVKQHDAAAKAADELAATPPVQVSAEDRAGFIEGKKAEAQNARDAAKEARDRAAEAAKAQKEAEEKAAGAGKKAEHPEIPVTEDEKASVKSENEAAISQAELDIKQGQQAKVQFASIEAQFKKTSEEVTKQAPPENVALMRKYSGEYKKVFERVARGGAATQPVGK